MLGEGTTDEMMLIYFTYTPYFPGDEDIIQDSTLLATGYQSKAGMKGSLSVFPNPTEEHLFLNTAMQADLKGPLMIEIFDLSGKVVLPYATEVVNGGIEIALDKAMAPGFYFGRIRSETGLFEFKFVKK
jgi:hypothetical protein